MTRTYIPVEEAARDWFKDPLFVQEYDALEEEFALAQVLIRVRNSGDSDQGSTSLGFYTT